MIGPLNAAGGTAISVAPGGTCASANNRLASASAAALFAAALAGSELAGVLTADTATGADTAIGDDATGGEVGGDEPAIGPVEAHPAAKQTSTTATPDALMPIRRTGPSFGFTAARRQWETHPINREAHGPIRECRTKGA